MGHYASEMYGDPPADTRTEDEIAEAVAQEQLAYIKMAEYRWDLGGVYKKGDLLVCPRCFLMVQCEGKELHRMWHDTLAKATYGGWMHWR